MFKHISAVVTTVIVWSSNGAEADVGPQMASFVLSIPRWHGLYLIREEQRTLARTGHLHAGLHHMTSIINQKCTCRRAQKTVNTRCPQFHVHEASSWCASPFPRGDPKLGRAEFKMSSRTRTGGEDERRSSRRENEDFIWPLGPPAVINAHGVSKSFEKRRCGVCSGAARLKILSAMRSP